MADELPASIQELRWDVPPTAEARSRQTHNLRVVLGEIAATRSALRQLADEEPVVYNSDRGYTTCAYCADYYEDDDHHNDKPHSSDCPWLAARVLVSDVSTQETTP